MRFSGVSINGGFVRLDVAQLGSQTGTLAGFPIDGVMGPTIKPGSSASGAAGFQFTGTAPPASTGITLAAIVSNPLTGGGGYQTIYTDNSCELDIRSQTGMFFYTSGGSFQNFNMVANAPYFTITSVSSSSGIYAQTLFNLSTGTLLTASGTTSSNTLSTGTIQIGYQGGSQIFNGKIAAVAVIKSYINLSTQYAWAQDPWSFWYPDIFGLDYVGATTLAALYSLMPSPLLFI